MTLGQLKTLVYARLEGNSRMYQDSEVTNAINGCYQIINLSVGWYQKTVPIIQTYTIANRHIYDFPSRIVFPESVKYEQQALEKVSLSAMANNWPLFLQDTTATTGNQVSRFCPIGIKKFVLHPADAVGGGYLEVTGIANPDPMVTDNDTVYIPKEGVTAVADYSAHIVQCKLQGVPFMQSLAMYRNYENLVKLNGYWDTFKQPNMYFDTKAGISE